MGAYFLNFYDLKEIRRDIGHLAQGSLSKMAKDMGIERIGIMHQAGSDSLVTSQIFFKLRDIYTQYFGKSLGNASVENHFNGWIYGLGDSINDDTYIDEYKHLTREYSTHSGKPINLSAI